ncbi:MAG: hypothetical protein KF795_02410 [Labilithrix sp.]|nr:hypothetical protein [Labilithrix sp.]
MTAAKVIEAKIASAESMRVRTLRTSLANGQWSEPRPYTDLRGTPSGKEARVLTYELLVLPSPHAPRRARERVVIRH